MDYETMIAPEYTPLEIEILEKLTTADGPLYGRSFMGGSAKYFGCSVSLGTLYPLLNKMEDKGLIASHKEETRPEYPGLPRSLYVITNFGRNEYAKLSKDN